MDASGTGTAAKPGADRVATLSTGIRSLKGISSAIGAMLARADGLDGNGSLFGSASCGIPRRLRAAFSNSYTLKAEWRLPSLLSSQASEGSTLASKKQGSRSRSSAKSTSSARRSSNTTGRTSRATPTSERSESQTSLFPTCGPEDSLARMSRWREWGRELGLRGQSLDSFTSLLDYLSKASPELLSSRTFQVSSLATEDETSESLFARWPASGILSDGVCLTAGSLESPSHAKESSLSDVIETSEVPQRYFLSPNAARGMLRRADRMGRSLFPPLRSALEILAQGQ